MNFSEALIALKEGKKIRLPEFKEGEYYVSFYLGIKKWDDFGNVGIHEETKTLSIINTKIQDKYNIFPAMKSLPPFVWAAHIMADDWEIVE